MPFFPLGLGDSESFKPIETRLAKFQEKANGPTLKDAAFARHNFLNKQVGQILGDLASLRLIAARISKDVDASELRLDMQSLYLFGKILSESVLYLASGFVKSGSAILWSKLGQFCQTAEKHYINESEDFRRFWLKLGPTLKNLQRRLNYRNDFVHRKQSTVEWTFVWPGHDNLDHAKIQSLPWSGDTTTQPSETTSARTLIAEINKSLCEILDYLDSNFLESETGIQN